VLVLVTLLFIFFIFQWQNNFTYFQVCTLQTGFCFSYDLAVEAVAAFTGTAIISVISPQHFWDPCIFCRRTKNLEFTAWSFARSSCWLRTI